MTRLIETFWQAPTALLLATALMWGGNAIAGQLAVGEVNPVELVTLRWAMVVAALGPFVMRELRPHFALSRSRIVYIALMAMAGFTVFNTLFYVASIHTSGVNIGILQGTMPVLVLMGAFLIHGARVGRLQALGVLITLAGVAVVTSRGDWRVLAELAFNRGDLVMLGACVLYSGYTVFLPDRPAIPARAFFFAMAVVAFVVSLPLLGVEIAAGRAEWPSAKGWAVTVFVAIFPSCLAQLTFMRGVELIGPGRAGVYVNLVPIFASILAILILGERFGAHHAAALALVLGGIWISQRR